MCRHTKVFYSEDRATGNIQRFSKPIICYFGRYGFSIDLYSIFLQIVKHFSSSLIDGDIWKRVKFGDKLIFSIETTLEINVNPRTIY